MSDKLTVRLADPDRDAEAVASIYRPAVEETGASFEEVAPDGSEMARRIRQTLIRTPWLTFTPTGTDAGWVGRSMTSCYRCS